MGHFSGITEYENRTLTIPFPMGEVMCWHCPLYWRSRSICIKSGEIIEDTRSTGRYCDLKEVENVQTTQG